RGGAPSSYDRVLASTLGFAAVRGLVDGQRGVMAGIIDRKIVYTPFEKAIKHHKDIKHELLELSRILAL
ncbi:MAG: 6-phosphofructokinase, partial [bacterium]